MKDESRLTRRQKHERDEEALIALELGRLEKRVRSMPLDRHAQMVERLHDSGQTGRAVAMQVLRDPPGKPPAA